MGKQSQIFLFTIVLTFSLAKAYGAQLATPNIEDIEYPDDDPPSKIEIELGKTLFFDPRLSANNRQSCASCHNPDLGFSDGMHKGIGAMGTTLKRNTPHLYNLAFSDALFWDGRVSTLEAQALEPIQAADEMNMSLKVLIPRLNAIAYYRDTFEQAYGVDGLTPTNLAKAIAAFERSIISNNSPFDRYLSGDKNALSPSQLRGLALFKGKAGCIDCHDGPNFTDDSYHNIGVGDDDPGRQAVTGNAKMWGAFKTPGLRNILLSAPYLHDGSAPTLEDVILLYNKGGNANKNLDKLIKPLDLNQQEIFDLVAFLGALTSPVIIHRPQLP